MGRYYDTNNFHGKFWFAVQPSFDPWDVFGMREHPCFDDDGQEIEGYTDFYLEKNDFTYNFVKSKLDFLFNKVGVVKEDRKYYFDSNEQFDKYYDKYLQKYAEKEKVDVLSLSRICLGLRIYNDLRLDGYCSMTADL